MKKRGAALVLLFGLACFLAGGAVATANLPGAVDRLTEVLSRGQGAAACPPALPTQPYPTNVTGGDAPTALPAVTEPPLEPEVEPDPIITFASVRR